MSQFGIHAWAQSPGIFFMAMVAWLTLCTWWCARHD